MLRLRRRGLRLCHDASILRRRGRGILTGFEAEFSYNLIGYEQNANPSGRYIIPTLYWACKIILSCGTEEVYRGFFRSFLRLVSVSVFLHALREAIGASGFAAVFGRRSGKMRRLAPGRVTGCPRQMSQSFTDALFLSLHFPNTMLQYIHGSGDKGWKFVTIPQN